MGRAPCCSQHSTLNRGAWTAHEDYILAQYIKIHGEGGWRSLPQKAGLKRCGKSCRIRWFNYLHPDVKRGNISADEEDLILRLHGLLGNRWALIAGRLPGRTGNEIKNYWNTHLSKKETLSNNKTKSKLAHPASDPQASLPLEINVKQAKTFIEEQEMEEMKNNRQQNYGIPESQDLQRLSIEWLSTLLLESDED